jgi:hypothetical protein
MAQDASALAHLRAALGYWINPGLLAAGILSVWSWLAMVKQLNPGFPLLPLRKSHPHRGRAWAAFLSPPFLAGALWLILNYFWKGMDLWLYNVPSPPFDGKPFLAYMVTVFAFIWVVVSPDGWAGPFLTQGGKTPKRYWACAAQGALFGLAFAAVVFYSIRLRDFLYSLNADVFHRAAGPSLAQALGLLGVFGLQGVLVFTTGFGLAPAFTGKASPVQGGWWKKTAGPLLLILSLLFLHLALYRQAVRHYEWKKKGLAEAAGLSTAAIPPSVCVSLDGTFPLKMKTWPMETRGFPASVENMDKLGAFFLKPNNSSRYLEEAFFTLPEMAWRIWDPQQAQAWTWLYLIPVSTSACRPSVDALEELVLWVSYSSPLTEDNRRLLTLLSDPKNFQIPGTAALDFAHGWIRFGNPQEARRCLELAANGKTPGEAQLEKLGLDRPVKVPLLEGSIQGKVALRCFTGGLPVKAGLFSVFEKGGAKPSDTSNFLPSLSHMTEAQWVQRDGSFRFDHLSQGTYHLAFLIPGGPWTQAPLPPKPAGARTHNPGLLTLTAQKPKIQTGTILIP